MKKVFLAAILLMSVNAFAQDLEIGIGGGLSTNTGPDGNMPYKQEQSLTNYAGTMKIMYTTFNYWQFGLDGHVMGIAGKTSKRYPGVFVDSVGGENQKLVYAKFAVSVCAVANKAFPFNKGKSYGYVGVALGAGSARNDHLEYTNDETYNGPDGGRGLCLGGQAGVVVSLAEKIGFNLDIAVRKFNFKYDAPAPLATPIEDLHYSVLTVPITVGIRYYLFRTDRSLIPRYNHARPMGRASY